MPHGTQHVLCRGRGTPMCQPDTYWHGPPVLSELFLGPIMTVWFTESAFPTDIVLNASLVALIFFEIHCSFESLHAGFLANQSSLYKAGCVGKDRVLLVRRTQASAVDSGPLGHR